LQSRSLATAVSVPQYLRFLTVSVLECTTLLLRIWKIKKKEEEMGKEEGIEKEEGIRCKRQRREKSKIQRRIWKSTTSVRYATSQKFRFQMRSLDFSIDLFLPAAEWPGGRLSL
jgi:hypothetical protein